MSILEKYHTGKILQKKILEKRKYLKGIGETKKQIEKYFVQFEYDPKDGIFLKKHS